MPASLTTPGTWLGGYYELALQFAPLSAECLDQALKLLWHAAQLGDAYLRPPGESVPLRPIPVSGAWLKEGNHLCGVATLPDGKRVPCGICEVQEEAAIWLDLYIPLGGLATAYDVDAFPFISAPESRTWREPLENWLAEVGRSVFRDVPFRLGLVGFEVSGTFTAEELAASGVPATRLDGILYADQNNLTWYPTNQWQPQP